MEADDRAQVLDDLHEVAAEIAGLAERARADPSDTDLLEELCHEVFMLREVLDELGVEHALLSNDAYGEITRARAREEEEAREAEGRIAVYEPGAVLGEVDGVPIVLQKVGLYTDHLRVHLIGRQNEITEELDRTLRAEFEAWIPRLREARAAGRPDPPPPATPAERLVRHPLRLTDDIGTEYRVGRQSWGGSETEWEAQARFSPSAPAGATTLTIGLDAPAYRDRTHAIRLDRT